MAYTIRYSDESIEDLRAISKHYMEINISLGNRFKEAFLGAESNLLRNPYAFSKINYKDFRRIIIRKFPYKVIYRIEKEIIQVFCVSHFARSNRYVKNRLRK